MEEKTIQVGMFVSMAIAILVIYFGDFMRKKFPILKEYCIPSPVVGGTIFAIITAILFSTNIVAFEFDYKTMNTFFYNVFFAASGAAASLTLLKKGGKLVVIFAVLAAVMAVLQNVIALGVGVAMDMNPLVALMAGSTPLTGGHGNAASFGPEAEKMGGEGALAVAIACATYGLIAGCMMGGPVGRSLIKKHNLAEGYKGTDLDIEEEEMNINLSGMEVLAGSGKRAMSAVSAMLLACGFGEICFLFFKDILPFSIPIHVWCMFGGIIVRLVLDKTGKGSDIFYNTVDIVGNVSLAVFVSLSIITMKLWQLAELALPLITILAVQTVVMILFAKYITYNLCGKDYDSAIIAVGHTGFGMGAVPVSVATMTSVCDQYHYSKLAFFVVPLIGGFISNITNALAISTFLNIAQGML